MWLCGILRGDWVISTFSHNVITHRKTGQYTTAARSIAADDVRTIRTRQMIFVPSVRNNKLILYIIGNIIYIRSQYPSHESSTISLHCSILSAACRRAYAYHIIYYIIRLQKKKNRFYILSYYLLYNNYCYIAHTHCRPGVSFSQYYIIIYRY